MTLQKKKRSPNWVFEWKVLRTHSLAGLRRERQGHLAKLGQAKDTEVQGAHRRPELGMGGGGTGGQERWRQRQLRRLRGTDLNVAKRRILGRLSSWSRGRGPDGRV